MASIMEGQARRAAEVARQIASVVRSDMGHFPDEEYDGLVQALERELIAHPEQTVITDDYIQILVCGDENGELPDWIEVLYPNISRIISILY